MLRNIDFEALKGLSDRHGAAFPRGRVIFRENDTSGEFYVILQGSVELSLKDPATGQKNILFVVKVGGFFGEMSAFSGMPRSATAVAAEDSLLLFFNQDTAVNLIRASPRFALGVIQTLCDRIRNNNERIAKLTVDGIEQPRVASPAVNSALVSARALMGSAATAARSAAPNPANREVPPADFDRKLLFSKIVSCPVCNTRFASLNVRPDAIQIRSRDSDFREIHGGPNPLWYQIYVCPTCRFAAYPDDFANVAPQEVQQISAKNIARQKQAEGMVLHGERDLSAARVAFQLAIDTYALRASIVLRLGGLLHRQAWLSREKEETESENSFLRAALEQYIDAMKNNRPDDPTTELMMAYTIGDLHLRLESPTDGVKWFAQTSQMPEFKKQSEIQRLVRERWLVAREMVRQRASSRAP